MAGCIARYGTRSRLAGRIAIDRSDDATRVPVMPDRPSDGPHRPIGSGQVVTRVDRLVVQVDLEVQVAPGGDAGRALVADEVADMDLLPYADDLAREVPVPGL